MNEEDLWGNSLELLREQVRAYREMGFDDLGKLPFVAEIKTNKPKENVTVIAYRDMLADGGMQITIVADKSRCAGIFASRRFDGFKVYPDGHYAPLEEKDLAKF